MKTARLVSVLLLMVVLGACSRPASRPDAEVAARVNGTEISVERFQQVLAQADFSATARPDPAQLMEAMIDRELLAQQARTIHLDRNALVVHALEGAQTGILAQAYVEHVASSAPPEARDVEDFHARNAALFKDRRIYRIFELAVIAPEEEVATLRARLPRARSLFEIAEWLKSRGVRFNVGGVTSPAERIAPELLRRLEAMEDGQLGMIEVTGGASVIQLIHSESAPLTLEQATPVIEQMLRTRRQAEVAQRQVEQLRSKASIQYVVDLKGAGAPPQPSAATAEGASP